MSNFNCQICARPNIDSEEGYIKGCRHYHPEAEGVYVLHEANSIPKRMGVSNLKWLNPEFDNCDYWEKIDE